MVFFLQFFEGWCYSRCLFQKLLFHNTILFRMSQFRFFHSLYRFLRTIATKPSSFFAFYDFYTITANAPTVFLIERCDPSELCDRIRVPDWRTDPVVSSLAIFRINQNVLEVSIFCLLYTSPSPRD